MISRIIHAILTFIVVVTGSYVGMMMDELAVFILMLFALSLMLIGMAVERSAAQKRKPV